MPSWILSLVWELVLIVLKSIRTEMFFFLTVHILEYFFHIGDVFIRCHFSATWPAQWAEHFYWSFSMATVAEVNIQALYLSRIRLSQDGTVSARLQRKNLFSINLLVWCVPLCGEYYMTRKAPGHQLSGGVICRGLTISGLSSSGSV